MSSIIKTLVQAHGKVFNFISVKREMSLREFLLFLLGLIIGFSNFSVLFYVLSTRNCETKLSSEVISRDVKRDYDEMLADKMFDEVKVLCMVMTYPDNHRTKAIHVMNTWGKRCNKLLFMSSKPDYVLNTIVLDLNDTRNELWTKSVLSFKHVYENHLNDFDWFLKADDDK